MHNKCILAGGHRFLDSGMFSCPLFCNFNVMESRRMSDGVGMRVWEDSVWNGLLV